MDVIGLFDVCINKTYNSDFEEVKHLTNEFHLIRRIRNCWAHQDPIDDMNIFLFLTACETVIGAIVTQDSQPSYDQVKGLKDCWLLFMADKVAQTMHSYDHNGQIILHYPELLPAFED